MPIIDWQSKVNYLNQNDNPPPSSKTLEDVYNWHLSRDEQDKYNEFSLLYYNVGPGAANRFAHYANLNPLLGLVDKDTPPPMFHQIRVPVGDNKTELVLKPGAKVNLPFKLKPWGGLFKSRYKEKYDALDIEQQEFFNSWYTIEKNIFYTREQKIHEHRFLLTENEELYRDVLATMLALPPLKDDQEQRPDYKNFHKHMAKVEISEVFQIWWKAYSTGQIEASVAFFDQNIIQLLPVFNMVFTVPKNEKIGRSKDTRQLSVILTRMKANENLGFNRSWQKNEEAKSLIGMSRKSTNPDDVKWFVNYNIAKKQPTGALYDFGPGLLQYDKDIGPLHNAYITDNVYHNNKGYKKPNPVESVKNACTPPNAYCYKS